MVGLVAEAGGAADGADTNAPTDFDPPLSSLPATAHRGPPYESSWVQGDNQAGDLGVVPEGVAPASRDTLARASGMDEMPRPRFFRSARASGACAEMPPEWVLS